MPKSNSSKRWQRNNPEKVDQYRKKFMSTRKQMSVTLEQWVIDAIDEVKPKEQPLGAWIREIIENWAKSRHS